MKKFADKKRVWGPTFKEGNKVYFLWKIPNIKIMFIRITRLSNKLDFIKLKFFKIIKVLGLVTYELDFPDSIKIIRIRHVLVLELVNLETPLIKDMPDINLKS